MIDLHARGWRGPLLETLYWVLVVSCIGLCVIGWWVGWIFLAGLGVLGLGVLVYGGFIEPRLVQTTMHSLGEGEKKLRLVFLSDFHAGLKKQCSFYQQIADHVRSLEPGLVILGGDFVDECEKDLEVLRPILELQPSLGMWFILGNHDFFDDPKKLVAALEKRGARDLTNQARAFKLTEADSLEVIGLDDSWYGSPDLRLLEKPKKGLRIIATHEPDLLLDLPENAADLVLLGHTHGGQIRLPWYGPVTPLPQSAPQWLDRGEKLWKGMRVIISRGLAESSVRARLGSRPEIVVVDIKK
jgi:predicted MPP superfamily phosphohydrolase